LLIHVFVATKSLVCHLIVSLTSRQTCGA